MEVLPDGFYRTSEAPDVTMMSRGQLNRPVAVFFVKNDFTLFFNKFLELGEVNNRWIFKGVRKWTCR